MPQNPGSSPIMDYNNAGPSQNILYGGPNQMPNPGNQQPGGPYYTAIGGGGGGYRPHPGGGFQPPVQNPGMPVPNPGMPMRPGLGDAGGMMLPGFVPGGPDDPARGGSGYMNGGGILGGGNRIDGGPNGKVYNPNPGSRPKIDGGPQGNVYNPNGAFQGLAKGTMPSTKKHVQSGKMGKAKQAFEAGGGKWTKDVHKRLKKRYG